MKKLLVFTALSLACCSSAFAQQSFVDSLEKAYKKNKQDTTLAQYYSYKAGITFLTTNVDSGLIYSRKSLALSRKIHYKKGEVEAMTILATFLNVSGDMPGSLKVTFEALPVAIRIHDMRAVASCYNTRGLVYAILKDTKKALDNYYASLDVVEKNHLTDLRTVELNNISRQYLDANKLDSAAYFTNKAYKLALKDKSNVDIGYLVRNFGIIQFKKGNPQGAINFYLKSMRDSTARTDHYLQSEDHRRIAEAYQKMGKADSCIDYAKTAFEQAKLDKNPDQVQRATKLLTDVFLAKGDYKAAFEYQQITLKAQDSLFSQQKTLQVQNLSYNEQQRRQAAEAAQLAYQNRVRFYAMFGVIGVFLLLAIVLLYANSARKKANHLLHEQKEEIEAQRDNLEKAYSDLKITQTQLVQSEKMASLGELTAGIAHEIQNPLNFVNNFSEVNKDLLAELKEEIEKGNLDEVKEIADNVITNEEKINHHGKRADSIVKSMLEHSRNASRHKEPADINIIADEYLRLSYHGLRAKDKSFNAELITNFEKDIPKANLVQQDIGRVLLNLFNNAFYAVNEKTKTAAYGYKPEVSVSTSAKDGWVTIEVKDNGTGIPGHVKDKIMQPFFTTKPTGEGTGLGLSLTYDMVVKGHGGSIDVDTVEGEYTTFMVKLPIN